MNRFILWLAIMMMSVSKTQAFPEHDEIYSSANISDELKKDAYTVKRYEKREMEITGPGRAGIHSREVVTILSEKGNDELFYYEYTNNYKELDDIVIRLYDKDGKQIEKYTKKDLAVQADGSGLVEDGKTYFIRLSAGSYPVTIEKEYTIHYRGFLQIPSFYFNYPHQSVEYSTFLVKYPASMKVNFKSYNIIGKPTHMSSGKDEVLQWESKSLSALRYEDNSGSWVKYFPHINFNSDKIEFAGYPGNLSNWNDMGLWYSSLIRNVNRLSALHQDDIRKLVEGISNDREKVKVLYSYLQNNFRYVSIQLGIGGFKPFPADFVHEKKYGDCKGLSNYMEACLAAINIKSYQVLIKSGNNETYLDPDFTYNAFDHVILVVPFEKDSIWLECTSNDNDFGHLGSFTENRYALLITENGGKLEKTPAGKSTDNILASKTNIELSGTGEGEIKTDFNSTGEYKYLLVRLSRENSDLHKQYLVNFFGFKNPDEFSITFDTKNKTPYVSKISLTSEKIYEFKAGTKMFIRPRMYKIWSHKLDHVEKRNEDYYLDFPLIKNDTTTFHLPEGFTVESLPKNKSISFPLGKYESTYWIDEKTKIVYSTARLEINTYKIEPALYEQARLFFDQVLDDGNQKIIFKNAN